MKRFLLNFIFVLLAPVVNAQKTEALAFVVFSTKINHSFDRFDNNSRQTLTRLCRFENPNENSKPDLESGESLEDFDSKELESLFADNTNIDSAEFRRNLEYLENIENQKQALRVEMFNRYFRNRFNDVRFFGVDFANPASLNNIDENDMEAFNKLFLRGVVRASEKYIANCIEPGAERYSDLVPENLKNIFRFSKTSLRLGYSRVESQEIAQMQAGIGTRVSAEQNENGLSLIDLDDPRQSQVVAALGDIPRAEARSELLQDFVPGEMSLFGRFKTQFCGWGVDWKPMPQDLPISLRVFKSHTYDGDSRNCEFFLNWDLLAFREDDNSRKYSLVLSTKFDTQSDDVFVGLYFSNN